MLSPGRTTLLTSELDELADLERFAALHATSWASMERIVDAVTAGVPTESPGQIVSRAVTVWAACHGFAALAIARVLEQRRELPSATVLEPAFGELVAAGALSGTHGAPK